MSRELRGIKGKDAIKAFLRAGGIERPGKGDHINIKMPNETDETDGRDKKSERIEQRSYSRIREVNSVDTTPKLGGPCNRGGGNTIAHRELKELVEKGVFRKRGAGKYIRYELTQG